MKTFIPKQSDLDQKIYVVDADGKTLGRLATKVASVLLGKHKPIFSYDSITGDQVVIINAKKVYVSGNKRDKKEYKHYSGWPSGLKTYNFDNLNERKPEEVIKRAVQRMLPKNHLGRKLMKRLYIYGGAEHKQQAQKPEPLEV